MAMTILGRTYRFPSEHCLEQLVVWRKLTRCETRMYTLLLSKIHGGEDGQNCIAKIIQDIRSACEEC